MPSSKNLKEKTYHLLKLKILSNVLKPNAYLEEKMLCDMTGVSRTPVREAINRLAQEGLVTMIPKKGAFVTALSIQDAKELFDSRVLMEPIVLRQGSSNIDFDVLMNFKANFLLGIEQKDYPYLHQQDYDFHNYLNGCCKNAFLIKTMNNLQDLFQMIRTQEFYSRERTENGALEHIQMIEMILKGEIEQVCEFLKLHIRNTQKYYFMSMTE